MVGHGHAVDQHFILQVGSEVQVSHELVHHQLLTDEGTGHHGFAPGHTDQEGQRGEQPAQQQLQGELRHAEPATHAGEDAVDHGDEADEGQQHGTHVQGQLQTGGGTGSGGVDHVGRLVVQLAIGGVLVVARGLGFRYQQLGEQQTTRGSHEGGGDQVFHLDAHGGVTGQHGAGNGGQATTHDGEQLGVGHLGDEGTHHQRGFSLADEDVGSGRQGFGTGGTQHLLQTTTQQLDHPLHDAEVIKNRDQGREEDDDGQYTEGEDETTATEHFEHLVADQTTEQEFDTVLTITDDAGDGIGHAHQNIPANRDIQHEGTQTCLNGEGTAHGTNFDCLAIAGEQHRDKDERRHPHQTHYQIHY